MPYPEIPLNDIVDLTESAGEEEPQQYRSSDRSPEASAWASSTQTQDPKAGKHRSPPSHKKALNGPTPTKPSAHHDNTPSITAKFLRPSFAEDERSYSTATNAPIQSCSQVPRGCQTPKTLTPKKTDWTIEKIANQLATFVSEVEKVHAKVVHYTLQETFKSAPRPRHLSSIDDFADMPSIAVEPENSTETTMSVKFKVSAGLTRV